MIDLDNITWTCHVCGERRPDSKISVAKHRLITDTGIEMGQNVRYCNDNPACEKRARNACLTQLALDRAITRATVADHNADAWKRRFWNVALWIAPLFFIQSLVFIGLVINDLTT